MEDRGTCPYYSKCFDVVTDATSKKALMYITKDVISDYQLFSDVTITFYHSSDKPRFAKSQHGSSGATYIAGQCVNCPPP